MNHISRRHFIWTGAVGITALAAGPACFGASTPRIRVGCQANGFRLKPGDFPALLAALRKMRDLDYQGFECNIRFVRGEFSRITEARKQIDETGVKFIGVHTSLKNDQSEAFPQWVEDVAALGGSCIVVSGAGRPDAKLSKQQAWRQKASSLEALGKTCRSHGLTLAYHNHNPEFADHNAEMNNLAEMTDPALVSFLMDAGHAHLGGGDPAAFMARFSKRIFGCHLKTFKGGQKHQVPLGKGDWGFEDLAAAIRKTDWTGWLIDEEGGLPAPPDTAALGPDREYIRRVFGV